MSPEEARRILHHAEEAAASTSLEECLALLTQLQEGSEGHSFLTASEKGTALGIEAFAKDLIAAEEGFCSRYLSEVLQQIRPGNSFLEGLARVLARLGRVREALSFTEELAQRLPGDWQIWADLAELRLISRHPEQAREALKRARDLAPSASLPALQRRLRDMDPEELLGLPAAAVVAWSSDRDGRDCFMAGWNALTLTGDFALGAEMLRQAEVLGFHHRGLQPLRMVAMARSFHPLHGRRALETAYADFQAENEAAACVARAVLLSRTGQSQDRTDLWDQALDLLLAATPPQQRDSELDWYLACASLMLRDAGTDTFLRLVERLLSHGEIGPPVLRAWRHLRDQVGRREPETEPCSLWAVRLIVEGRAARHASDSPSDPGPVGEVKMDFAVAYEVAVEAPDEIQATEYAGLSAMELEKRLGGVAMEVSSMGAVGLDPGAIRRPLGALRRSGRIFHQGDGIIASG